MKASTEFATQDQPADENQGQEANTYAKEKTDIERAGSNIALAAASLKQAWQDLPDITAVADHIDRRADPGRAQHRDRRPGWPRDVPRGQQVSLRDDPQGDRRDGALARQAAQPASASPATPPPAAPTTIRATAPWELSFDRANVARQILEEFGVSDDRIESVVGRGDADPFFPNDPYLSANQRVSILLVYEKPPVPVDLKP